MSGHSKWSTIKRAKAVVDAKRGKVFTKLSKNISLAAKQGKDPDMNPALRQAVDTARSLNMPKDNIEKAILKGVGELPGQELEELTYEVYAPGGVAMMIKAVTDNTNRTVADIKAILNKNNAKLARANAVAHMFQEKEVADYNKVEGNEKVDKLIEALEELEDIEAVYTNAL